MARVEPWNEIEEFFIKFFEGNYNDSMALLVKHIITTGLSSRLFAYTSMNRLIISIYDPIEWNREALHIFFNTHTKKWNFAYYSKPFQTTNTFRRQYERTQGIEKFDAFIKMVGW